MTIDQDARDLFWASVEMELRSGKTPSESLENALELVGNVYNLFPEEKPQAQSKKCFQIDIQRLRNLTTGRVHTDLDHIYEDLEVILGVTGIRAYQLQQIYEAVEPWLRKHVTDSRFWEPRIPSTRRITGGCDAGELDATHTGELTLPEPTVEDRAEMLKRVGKLILKRG